MSDTILLLGHRGSRSSPSVPENTLASFDLSLEHGCDGFEFDVRLTACGRSVICHDPKVRGVSVAEATATQLLDLPVLESVLQRYAQKAFLDIELKVQGLESKTLSTLREYRFGDSFVVSSFLPEVVTELKTRSAKVQAGIICDKAKQLDDGRRLPVEYLIPHHSLVTRALVDDTHKADKRLITWTVNDRAAMLRLADWGVDGIISDETELLVKTLRGR